MTLRHTQLFRKTCNAVNWEREKGHTHTLTHKGKSLWGIWLECEIVDGACGSEEEAAACQSVVIQVHTPRHLCQLMRETQLRFI